MTNQLGEILNGEQSNAVCLEEDPYLEIVPYKDWTYPHCSYIQPEMFERIVATRICGLLGVSLSASDASSKYFSNSARATSMCIYTT